MTQAPQELTSEFASASQQFCQIAHSHLACRIPVSDPFTEPAATRAGTRVQPSSIVEAFNVLEASQARLMSRIEVDVELTLKGGEEALRDGVVPAISASAHAANHTVRFELTAMHVARVLP